MRKKIIDILKRIYSRLLRFEFVWKLRRKAKKIVEKRRYNKYKKGLDQLKKKYEGVTLEETILNQIEIEPLSRDTGTFFGYDVLGQIEDIELCDYVEYGAALSYILDNGDIDIRIAIAEEGSIEDSVLEYFREKLKLFVLHPGSGYLVQRGDYRAAFIGTRMQREGDADSLVLNEELVKSIIWARNNTEYVCVYVLREEHKNTTTTPYERAFLRKLANLGCNVVFCANSEGIHIGSSILRSDKSFTYCISSMGSLFGKKKEENGASIAVRCKLIPTDTEGTYITNRGYIPLYNEMCDGRWNNLTRIDYHNGEHRRDSKIMEALAYIEEETGMLRDIRNVLTIQDICDVLGVKMPERYSYLANASVGKVCARSFEVNNGDVLFFREPFTDPNDGEPKPLEIRMRIVEKAMNRGARFVFSYVDLDESIPHVRIDNAREAHITVCAHIRQMYEVRTIGITGSVGKTSTKDMMYNVLSEKYKTYRNLRNSNTQVNIGMHIQNFRGGYEFFIQEIGGGRPGGASRHSRMILPEATVITNIGDAHIGNYGCRENTMESKLGIIDGMDSRGTLFLNGDDELLVKAKVPADVVYYAVNNKKADYYAEDIVECGGQTQFDIVHGEKKVHAVLNVLGHYNVLNAVCCYAIGKKFGLEDEEIVSGISKFETSGVRQNLLNVAGFNLFVDCFNASPTSIDSSLSVLDKIETDKKKIAVIGDVTGMAELSSEIHTEIGEIVKKHKMDVLICYGEESKTVYNMAMEAGYNAYSIVKPNELERFVMKIASPGDVLLFKGSSKMLLAERIDNMFGTMLADQRYIDGVKYKSVRYNKVDYNIYPEYATVVNCKDYDGKIYVSHSIRGRVVYNIGDGAFSDKENISAVKLPKSIRHIGAGSFHGCGQIKKIELPANVKYIDESAFAECNNMKSIRLPKGLLHIGDNAFAGCTELTTLELPNSIAQMGENVFANCDNLTVTCKKGSYAEAYCEKNGVQYVSV